MSATVAFIRNRFSAATKEMFLGPASMAAAEEQRNADSINHMKIQYEIGGEGEKKQHEDIGANDISTSLELGEHRTGSRSPTTAAAATTKSTVTSSSFFKNVRETTVIKQAMTHTYWAVVLIILLTCVLLFAIIPSDNFGELGTNNTAVGGGGNGNTGRGGVDDVGDVTEDGVFVRTADYRQTPRVFYPITDEDIANAGIHRRFPTGVQALMLQARDQVERERKWCAIPTDGKGTIDDPVANIVAMAIRVPDDANTGIFIMSTAVVYNAEIQGTAGKQLLLDVGDGSGKMIIVMSEIYLRHQAGVIHITDKDVAVCIQILLH
jgi:hypothetical protein